jgi:hypothetical protein
MRWDLDDDDDDDEGVIYELDVDDLAITHLFSYTEMF